MSRTLSVSAIQNGTVIDHITAGQALRIVHMLHLLGRKSRITLGINLFSKRLQFKDLIKIEDYFLTHEEANKITIFAPQVTINIIKDFEVVEKIITNLPKYVAAVFSCPNTACITHVETLESYFHIEEQGKQIKLICQFCEHTFGRNQVVVKI